MPISRIKTDGINDDSITTAKIADDAVNSAKIGVDVIAAEDLAANSVTVSEISDGAVTGDKLASNLNYDSGTLYLDSTNNRVGIGMTSPSAVLDVKSSGATSTAFRVLRSSTNTNLHAMTEISGHGRLSVYDGSENEDIRLDSNGDSYFTGGNVGIGTSSPETILHATASSAIIRLTSDANGTSGVDFGDSADTNIGRLLYDNSDNSMRLTTNASERMRIDSSGNLLVGTTTHYSASYRMSIAPASGTGGIVFQNNSTSGVPYAFLNTSGTVIGYITTSNTATSYVTASDYRLKENVTATWDATTRLKQLNPVRFNFIDDADTTVDGFLAHEVQSVVPEAISGTKDEVDDEGNPVYQGVDQSKLVPLLVKTIQELEARITALESN